MAAIVNVPSVASNVRAWARGPAFGLAALVLATTGGCFTAQLDPDLAGVYVCGESDDEDADACPSSLVCVDERCEDPDLVPSLAVLDPEDERAFVRAQALDLVPEVAPGMRIPLEIRIHGSISLVSDSSGVDHVFGEGHVKVFVDGEEQVTIDDGSIDASTPVLVEVPPLTGAHRIVLQAYRNDGVAYGNPEATASRLFWFENVAGLRPFVAIKSPLPGAVFDLDDQEIAVEVATLNFELLEPGGAPAADRGHAHLYYDHYDDRVRFPGCVQDPGCDSSDLGVAGMSKVGELDMPSAAAGRGVVTAVLRNGDHTPYGHPFGCDPLMPTPTSPCMPIFDAIDVVRVED